MVRFSFFRFYRISTRVCDYKTMRTLEKTVVPCATKKYLIEP